MLDLDEATSRDLAVHASGPTKRFGDRTVVDAGKTTTIRMLLSEIEHICDRLIMISDGKTVFQGGAAKIRATRGDELILRPETASSLASLLTLVQGAGFAARVEEFLLSPPRVVVEAGSVHAAALNRLPRHADITLIHTSERARSVGEAFFELTGTHARDVETAHSLGRVA